ncbi:methylmalonate-semialdehyde dehydrogenase [Gemmatirosa kalamazoonensis]|uniref:Methylmalonate-semialdehyde dehydrogenase n=1 Tax=Gemmatirosa kalamazoonensis TaxID=861299 RepID=W0RHH1_9BACT|nr:CoA-acylating methylmalonate-semialdehyde dehydrogenase [Gemmatirosa kalamazoonensis]AHG90574.1 methylmalonate-semialdehyde dehydrogenase [Gemmatirosa kalamazoonensis]
MKYDPLRNHVGGALVDADLPTLDVYDPSHGTVISRVPLSGAREVDAAVQCARAAFPAWSALPIKERVQVFFRYKALLERDVDTLAALVSEENGKIESEARAEILKAAELCEFACSLPQIATGELLEVSRGVECRVERFSLGVVASIAPFNFPNMVPHWTIPNAIALGNCMILKPSELVPLSANRTAELLLEAGLPAGVFQVVHGGRDAVEAICDHPDIAAVSFVGSTATAKVVYRRATSNLKRCLALGGAKNHLIVMPDADREMAASNIVASMSGCAGQRCMAASVMVAVRDVDPVIARMVEVARAMVPGRDIGPVISAAALERIVRYVDEAEAAGATVLVDGRGVKVPGKEGGYFIGPTIIDHVTPDMRIAREEVFGPVLAIVRATSLDEAIAVENASPYGNAASVYTESGAVARRVFERASTGMVGVNVGVPVPREPFSFGGWYESRFGVGDITGKGSIEFWTQSKKLTTKWNRAAGVNWMS